MVDGDASNRERTDESRYVVSGVPRPSSTRWARRVVGDRRARVRHHRRDGLRVAAAHRTRQRGMNWTEWLFDTHGVKYTKVLEPICRRAISRRDSTCSSCLADLAAAAVAVEGRGGGGGGGGRGGRGGPAAHQGAGGPNDAVRAVDEFVRAGGTVLTWGGGAASMANALQLPVQNTTAGLSRKDYFTGTSIMQVVDRRSRIP